ncbi:hypothetical protein BGZ60DRAFT_551806 [Tricladium varicosporioides]|nr:hypothetical protein BGZ60DRAFT_551806 [Hymenoscyphus varicosporioides]
MSSLSHDPNTPLKLYKQIDLVFLDTVYNIIFTAVWDLKFKNAHYHPLINEWYNKLDALECLNMILNERLYHTMEVLNSYEYGTFHFIRLDLLLGKPKKREMVNALVDLFGRDARARGVDQRVLREWEGRFGTGDSVMDSVEVWLDGVFTAMSSSYAVTVLWEEC